MAFCKWKSCRSVHWHMHSRNVYHKCMRINASAMQHCSNSTNLSNLDGSYGLRNNTFLSFNSCVPFFTSNSCVPLSLFLGRLSWRLVGPCQSRVSRWYGLIMLQRLDKYAGTRSVPVHFRSNIRKKIYPEKFLLHHSIRFEFLG